VSEKSFLKKRKEKKKPGEGQGENKVPKKKKKKKNRVDVGCRRDRKENPISAPSIHVGALVGAGSLWPRKWAEKVD
jgi:hypothetical protein